MVALLWWFKALSEAFCEIRIQLLTEQCSLLAVITAIYNCYYHFSQLLVTWLLCQLAGVRCSCNLKE
jgi:hypothetical protein